MPGWPGAHAAEASYNGTHYQTDYVYYVPQAWRSATTYYYWRCFYLCDAAVTSTAEERSGSSFTVVRGSLCGGWAVQGWCWAGKAKL